MIYRNIDSFEKRSYHESVVIRSFLDQFYWGFEGVKEGMYISEEYRNFAAGAKEVSKLDLSSIVSKRPVGVFLSNAYHGYEVGAVRSVMSEIGVS